MIRSLRLRLALGAMVMIAAVLLVLWAVLSQFFTDFVVGQYRTEMEVLSDSLTASVSVKDGKLVLTSAPSDPRLNLPGGGRYWELEENDKVLDRSRSLWDTIIDEDALKPTAYSAFKETIGPDGEPMLVMSQESTLGEGENARHFCIFTAFPKAELDVALTGFHGELRSMLLLTACILLAGALIQAFAGLAPLDRLKRKVAEVRAGLLAEIGDEGPSEVRPLVAEIDLLLKERQEAVERARSRASDLAHGLKTPLTVLSQLAAAMDPKSADIALRQVDAIRQRADRQLQAARLGVERLATTDLGELTGKLVQVLKPVTDARSLHWRVDMSGDLRVSADPADLAEAIGNVLDNAGKWARSTISIAADRKGDRISVLIEDDGPGVSAADYQSILERGNGTDADAGGTGLGLAITRDIVEAYGATITPGKSELGGLQLRFDFPVKPVRQPSPSPA